MNGLTLIIVSFMLVLIVVAVISLYFIRKIEAKKYKEMIKQLDIRRNLVASMPIDAELSKVEPIIKSDKIEEKFKGWADNLEVIKNEKLPLIDDMLIELDLYVEKKDYKNFIYRIAKTEMEIYKVRESSDHLLDEIKEITLSEEKYRNIVIKLKTKFRKLNKDFQDHKGMYDEIQDAISLQFENIEKRFLDFEKVMENNEYSEVVKIVKALDTMIDHMNVVIEEVPDLVLLSKQLIPNRVKEIKSVVEQMEKDGFPIEYLNIDYNLEETEKNVNTILDKIRVLNLEDSMFELKTMLEYLDSLFVDFEKERLSRKVYEEMEKDFSKKLEKTNNVVKDIFDKLDDIKNSYDLDEEDLKNLNEVKKVLIVINDDYKKIVGKVNSLSTPYSVLHKDIEDLTVRLSKLEDDLDITLKSLGNMYDDEQRAREQLEEIQLFLKQSKNKIRTYKLPIITDNYFVQLSEANDAILEVIKELEKKPIVIETLNTRVDTARDLVLKLYNTTNEMIKTAQLAEMIIVYGNRYRAYYDDIDVGLSDAESKFYKGNYKSALDIAIKATSIIDKDIYSKLLAGYDK